MKTNRKENNRNPDISFSQQLFSQYSKLPRLFVFPSKRKEGKREGREGRKEGRKKKERREEERK